MGIISFFHKIRIGFTRMGEASVPYVNSAKRYGDRGEEEFIANLQSYLPECKIKQNVLIMTNEGILTIQTRDGKIFDIKEENAHIKVIDNGNIYKLAFCKLDYIEIGKR